MVRIISISSISLVLRSAPLARVSKDGHRRDRARGHPSRRPREERGLLRMRSEGLNSIVRYDWFHGIGLLVTTDRGILDCPVKPGNDTVGQPDRERPKSC